MERSPARRTAGSVGRGRGVAGFRTQARKGLAGSACNSSSSVGVLRNRSSARNPYARQHSVAWWWKPAQERPSKWSRPSSSFNC